MRISAASLFTAALLGPAAAQEAPLSAIDWLSDGVAAQAAAPALGAPVEPAAGGVKLEEITVTPLGETSADAVGLLPSAITGLPRDLWGSTSSAELAKLIRAAQTGLLPAPAQLLFTVLLAELDPPADSDPSNQLFLARIDALTALGAVDQARALIERAGADDPESFRRYFDASLLTGTEDTACSQLIASPDLAPSFAARIFCLARTGDWQAATVTLQTARVLGETTGAEDAALTRFLDPETFDGAPPLPAPARPDALLFRLHEAIGEPLPTGSLPLAFAQADLRPVRGWKAQIEAAERLARSGAIDGNRLLGLYTERLPAASGGVWDRVAAVQRFDLALASGDPGAVADTLPPVWQAMGNAGLRPIFAALYADKLQGVAVSGDAGDIAFEAGLLSNGYETAATARAPESGRDRFLKALARGDLAGVPAPDGIAAAIAEGFQSTGAPGRLTRLVDRGDLGAAILQAIALTGDAAQGDLPKLSDALALFRAVGLEDAARRTALQMMILEPGA
ncbi:MAG: hypothetical protein QNJ44_12575 [Rhodobacter sp.]|nr:hypothetical protein [Rhodobacter sp.]